MQLLGVLILLGILALLLIAGIYLGSTEKTHNKPESSLDDFYRSSGFGNVVDANKHIREVLSDGEHPGHGQGHQGRQGRQGKQQQRQQRRHGDER